jgi:hypothetical protein
MEGNMSFVFGLLAVIAGLLGIYLLMLDADLLGQTTRALGSLLDTIDAGNQPFAKGVILLCFAVAFAILALVSVRVRNKKNS